MQRLYSTFPSGRPGFGLLLLRLAAGGSLFIERTSMLLLAPSSPLWETQTVLVLVAVCICFGLWTPVVSALEAVSELLMALSRPVVYESHTLLAVVALSLVFLGPGAWSVDALLFGRKRIAI